MAQYKQAGCAYSIILLIVCVKCSDTDITHLAFGGFTDGMPAAFGDFNSDELTDVFILLDNGKTMEILLAHEEEPLLRPSTPDRLRCTFSNSLITSVVPGDFDGDALMDVLVTTIHKRTEGDSDYESSLTYVYVIWGGANHLNCSHEETPLIKMIGQPLAIDYNQDMIIDLFGQDEEKNRMFWVFDKSRGDPTKIKMEDNRNPMTELSRPHAHAFLDLNDDFMPDLFITTKDDFEIWNGNERRGKFVYNSTIPHPQNTNKQNAEVIGQSLFIDVELKGRMDLVTPVCFEKYCNRSSSALMVYSEGKWLNLQVNFKDDNSNNWRFYLKPGSKYTNVITLHSGDFNMDGYPDILATLAPENGDHPKHFF
ncbi:hypothetical protein NQ314_005408 [Rhamnusium bicolor]|uniref:T-cell immunomodulatory protein n=1 Tax=Rhamnusium bicolor TaxID=1586634 RepID=A0AAV8ZGY1_9CUCU|nr:hypothetical protein NQ314_005408 [Rhamnusium bicolor]